MLILEIEANAADEMVGVNHSPVWVLGKTGDVVLLYLNKQWVGEFNVTYRASVKLF